MARDVFSRREWERAWNTIARRRFEAFRRAATPEAALEAWRMGQVLDDARTVLADAVGAGDNELVAALDPINPYQEIA